MTPTLTAILMTALFWTMPASAAVFVYRAHDSSIENLKRSVERAFGRPQAHDA